MGFVFLVPVILLACNGSEEDAGDEANGASAVTSTSAELQAFDKAKDAYAADLAIIKKSNSRVSIRGARSSMDGIKDTCVELSKSAPIRGLRARRNCFTETADMIQSWRGAFGPRDSAFTVDPSKVAACVAKRAIDNARQQSNCPGVDPDCQEHAQELCTAENKADQAKAKLAAAMTTFLDESVGTSESDRAKATDIMNDLNASCQSVAYIPVERQHNLAAAKNDIVVEEVCSAAAAAMILKLNTIPLQHE